MYIIPRRSSGVAPRACVRVCARVCSAAESLPLHTYIYVHTSIQQAITFCLPPAVSPC